MKLLVNTAECGILLSNKHMLCLEVLIPVLILKSELMSRYVKFLDSLLNNKSSEVQFLVKTALSDVRRLPRLVKLLERRRVMEVDLMCTKEISGVIDSLCSS